MNIDLSIAFAFLLICSFGNSKVHLLDCKKSTNGQSKQHFVSWYDVLWRDTYSTAKNTTAKSITQLYYKVLSQEEQFYCMVLKSFGGQWIPSETISIWCNKEGGCETWPQMDGVKNICMDTLYKRVSSNTCMIYSFGLADDWTFEECMSNLGCTVRAFDPTIQGPPKSLCGLIISLLCQLGFLAKRQTVHC